MLIQVNLAIPVGTPPSATYARAALNAAPVYAVLATDAGRYRVLRAVVATEGAVRVSGLVETLSAG